MIIYYLWQSLFIKTKSLERSKNHFYKYYNYSQAEYN